MIYINIDYIYIAYRCRITAIFLPMGDRAEYIARLTKCLTMALRLNVLGFIIDNFCFIFILFNIFYVILYSRF